jgi:hypothetical protein
VSRDTSDANLVLELERLPECLEAAQATLQATEVEAEIVCAQLANADARVVGESFGDRRFPPSWPIRFLTLCMFLLELETEEQTLRQAMDTATGYVHARGEHLEEHLLDVPERIKDAVEYGVHHGAVVALTAT